jgi:epoxyqueuosine reductase
MLTKQEIIHKAHELGFEDIGFTTIEPFTSQKEILKGRLEEYEWLKEANYDLIAGTDPRNSLSNAKSIIVVIEPYFREQFPQILEKHFGRCYLDDDRIIRKRAAKRAIDFLKYLSKNGIKCSTSKNLGDKIAAARAGLGTFGRNCLFFAKNVALGSSFNSPLSIVIDQEYEPDESTINNGCPDWCKYACVSACPTGALKKRENNYIDPKRCICYLNYKSTEITPLELREPMGLYIYGCDRCQDVCPRNRPWLAKAVLLPQNEKAQTMIEDFDLVKLLHMNQKYFSEKIWKHMFYTPPKDLWRWKMNVARAMGNSLDTKYIPELIQAFKMNEDERILGMIAWSLGNIGGSLSLKALEEFEEDSKGLVKEEIILALRN